METLFLKSLLILLLVATVAIGSTAFVIPKTVYSSVSVSGRNNNNAAAAIVVCKLSSSSDNSNDGSGSGGSSGSSGDAWVLRNKDRTDIRNFLTQRSIQSFVYLLNQCREEHTVRWLEVRNFSFSQLSCLILYPMMGWSIRYQSKKRITHRLCLTIHIHIHILF